MDEPDSFGAWIRRRRKALDLTREALAERVGCATVTIRKIEADERRPSREIAARLADALAVPGGDREAFLKAARAELAVAQLASPPTPAVGPLPAGAVHARGSSTPALKGYTLHEQLGAGGFGAVYRATQPGVGRAVAVKLIRPDLADQPDFVRRFEAEARLVARLEHPHIVPLYDYWRGPGGAFLVMRYMGGGSVQAALGTRWPVERCTQLLEQVGPALAFAHRQGVIHRDLKPGNLLLDEDGGVYLADFGIAKTFDGAGHDGETQPGAVLGSPDYLSPEQIRDEALTPATDIYGLGVLLYVLLAGAHPLAALTPAERIARQLTAPLPPLRQQRPDLPATLEAVLQRATAKPPTERYQEVPQLIAAWHEALAATGVTPTGARATPVAAGVTSTGHRNGPVAAGAPTDEQPTQAAAPAAPGDDLPTEAATPLAANPYKGLRPFGEGDEADFFGRESLIRNLIERLAEADSTAEPDVVAGVTPNTAGTPPPGGRFLAVVGPSGSGKSSVVRAGLIPALRRGALPGSERWFIAELLPGAHPLEELEAALLRVAVNPPEQLLGQLREDERGLLRAVKRVLPADPSVELLLVIDQFEELFTLVDDEAARTHLLASLSAAVSDQRSRLRLVITLRADLYDRPLLYPAFAELMRARTALVLPLSAPELRRAIVAPAARVGVSADADLVAEMIKDVGEQPGALPLLQYALTELYEGRRGPALTLGNYQTQGGVAGALARRADTLFAQLGPEAQEEARQIFLRLVMPGEGSEDTRRRVRISELAVGAGRVAIDHPTLACYGAYRLLTFDRDPLTREPTVEVAHEALIRSWGRLRAWLAAARDELRAQRRLTAAAAEWEVAGRDPSFLAGGARLAQFAALAASEAVALNPDEGAFLEASQRAAQDEAAAQEEQRKRELEAAQRLAAAETARAEQQQRLAAAETARAEQQQRAAAQLRRGAFALAAALVAALALAGAALYFGLAADRNARQAQEASRLATSRELAAAAVSNLTVDPERSVLLALRANEVARTRQAGDALQQAVMASRVQRVLPAGQDQALFITTVAFSPDGARAVVSPFTLETPTWETQIVDTASGSVLYTIPGWSGNTFWPEGDRLTSEHPPGDQLALTVWELEETQARPVSEFSLPVPWPELRLYGLSPDYALLALTRLDGTLTLYRTADGVAILDAGGAGTIFLYPRFSPDGSHLAVGTEDGRIMVWKRSPSHGTAGGITYSPAYGTDTRPFTGLVAPINTVAFSPDGTRLAAAISDGTVGVWELTTLTGETLGELPGNTRDPRLLLRLRGHTNEVFGMAWSPDGTRLASSGRDRQIIVWDAMSGERLFTLLGHSGTTHQISFSPDGTRLLSGSEDGTVRIWDVTPAHELRAFTVSPPTSSSYWLPMKLSRDGRRLIAASPAASAQTRIVDPATGAQLAALPNAEHPTAGVALSADGSRAATASSGAVNVPQEHTPFVAVWDTASGALIRRFEHESGFISTALSPDGTRVAATSTDKQIYLWEVDSGSRLVLTPSRGAIDPWPVVFSPDGARLATGAYHWDSATGVIDIWDTTSGQNLLSVSGHEAFIFGLAFDAHGERLASASRDGTAKIWDAATGELLQTMVGHTSTVQGVAWSPDGSQVATASFDATARLWDVASGQELRVFSTLSAATDVAFSPDGAQIYVASIDGIARVYLLNLDDLIALARTRVTRALTLEECRTYLHSETC